MNEDRAARYHRLRRRSTICSMLIGAAYLLELSRSGVAVRLWRALQQALGAHTGPRFASALAIDVAILAIGYELIELPFVFYRGFVLEQQYGLSSESIRTWMADHVKAGALGVLLMVAAAAVLFGSVAAAGRWWWLAAGAAFTIAGAFLAGVAPVLLMPIFYRFRPLARESLRTRLVDLSARAGVRVVGAFEWGLGEKTRRGNAALVGLGRTRRIIVSDTLLADYSDDEIAVVLAHELGHHVHHDMWKAILFEGGASVAALGIGGALTAWWAASAGASGPADPAALPLLALCAGLVLFALAPAGNALSRHNERAADRFALRLTGQPPAFITAMRRLGAQNLAEVRPSAPVVWFFHTHPTIEERIDAARRIQHPPAPGQPLRG
ncbi:MAG TPA: M48 family metallopeptidase [Vicinamibacterales bacterium]|nr:M48 family metallopeptidase [Vicinamibacterales bacterium]